MENQDQQLINGDYKIKINMSADTYVEPECSKVLMNKVIFDENTCGHVFILDFKRSETAQGVYLLPINFSQN